MGVDFVRRAAPGFHRALDRRAADLRTPTLFTSDITSVARTASAELCNGTQLTVGERILVRVVDEKLVVQRDNAIVATFPDPPAEYVNTVHLGSGVAGGEVTAIQPLSGVVEVAICE